MSDAAAALAENGIHLRDIAPGNHKTPCPACSHSRKKKTDPCLSVTIGSDGRAVWNCHHCGWAGAAGGDGYRPHRERKAYRKPVRVEQPQQPETMIAWFAKRAISANVLRSFGVYKTRQWFPQIDGEADCIAFPYEWKGELRNVKYRTVDKNFRQEKDPEPTFYNADSIAAGEDLLIAEGEVDVLSLAQAGFEHVVSLPNGAPSNPQEESDKRYEPFGTHWEEIVAVKRLLIATDMDEPGELLAQEIAKRVGKDRCYRVRMPFKNDVQCKDANECLVDYGAEALRECVAAAEPWPIEGLHDVETYAIEVMDLYDGNGPQPMSTGFPELDKAFQYIPGQFIAMTGIPNHGKSRFLDQIAVQTSRLRNEKWAMFSPETGNANHVADLCEIWAGLPFFAGPTYRMSADDVAVALAWLNDRIFLLGAVEHTPTIDWLLERARAAVVRHGVTNLVIDPYNELEASRPERQTETEFVSQMISKLKRFAAHHSCTVWMIIHPTKLRTGDDGKEPMPGLYDLAGSAHWRNKADAGIVVYRDYEKAVTFVVSKKIRRQPMCGRPGAVKFSFIGTDRRFQDIEGSYQALGSER